MAWTDATNYNTDKQAAAKADLAEITSIIDARVAVLNRTRGRLSLEEEELLLVKEKVDGRHADIQSIADVAAAKTAIAGATYAMDEADVAEGDGAEPSIVAAIVDAFAELELKGVSYVIEKQSYTAVSGSTPGTYKFKVALEKFITSDKTDELTMTITPTA